jgi:3-oxoacyl-[acyl-carrier protein] reductase
MTGVSRSMSGRVALVTGASRGIGKAIAARLAGLGANIAVNDVEGARAAGESTAHELRGTGVEVVFVAADVSRSEDVAGMVAEVERLLGPVDILVNNAGITRDGLFVRMEESDWDAVMAVNLKGAFLTSKAVARGMMKRRRGAIVNLSSVVALRGNAGQANYAAAKAGLVGLTKSLARELAPRNIRVNAVAPGYIQTSMTEALSEAAREAIHGATPLDRIGMPEDVADAVAFLAGDGASFITGVVLPVDGGLGI